MAKSEAELALSERLRALINEELGVRGKFSLLERMSSIPLNRWKNFLYGKQSASVEMIEFAVTRFPGWANWLRTGIREEADYPFDAPMPLHLGAPGKIAQRLTWAIHEFAGPRGEELFAYLEKRSGKRFSSQEWADVIVDGKMPSVEMILVVTSDGQPHLFEWICRGRVSYPTQIDPADSASIELFRKLREDRLTRLQDRACEKP